MTLFACGWRSRRLFVTNEPLVKRHDIGPQLATPIVTPRANLETNYQPHGVIQVAGLSAMVRLGNRGSDRGGTKPSDNSVLLAWTLHNEWALQRAKS